MTNQEYIEKIRNGDSNAFNKLYKEVYWDSSIKKEVLGSGGSEEEVKELIWIGLGKLYIKLNKSPKNIKGRIMAYTYRICYNYWLKHLEKKNKRNNISLFFIDFFKENEEALQQATVFRDETPGAQETMEQTHLRQVLQEMIKKLKPVCQEFIFLRFYQNMNYKEIAQHYDMEDNEKSTNMLRQRWHKCKKKLKKLLENSPFKDDLKNTFW